MRVFTLVAGLVGLSACTLVPIDEAQTIRQRASGALDASPYVASIWPAKVDSAFKARAISIEQLRAGPLDTLGVRQGHRAGEGSPWTFVVRGEGVVREIAPGPHGRIELDTPAGPATLQTGPVVSGTAIRDALPSIDFDAFPDQISFAEVGIALTDKARARLLPVFGSLQVGMRVRFTGAASLSATDAPLIITPTELARS